MTDSAVDPSLLLGNLLVDRLLATFAIEHAFSHSFKHAGPINDHSRPEQPHTVLVYHPFLGDQSYRMSGDSQEASILLTAWTG